MSGPGHPYDYNGVNNHDWEGDDFDEGPLVPEKGPAPNPPGPEHGEDCDEGEGTELCYGVDLGRNSQPEKTREKYFKFLLRFSPEWDENKFWAIMQNHYLSA